MAGVGAVVVTLGQRPEMLDTCLDALDATFAGAGLPPRTVVVLNGAGEDAAARLRAREVAPEIVALERNEGFAGGVDAGLARLGGAVEWAFTVNDDAAPAPGALAAMLAAGAAAPRAGTVAAVLRFADRPGTINSAGIEVDRLGVAADRLLGAPLAAAGSGVVEVFGASAGAALYRTAMLAQIGGFVPAFFAYLEDVDVAWRARAAGWTAVLAADALVDHHHSATSGHASAFKHWHVGRNRVWLLARNATRAQLLRYGAAIVAFDLSQCGYALVRQRTLAPLRGRARGLAGWRRARAAAGGAPRLAASELRAPFGLRAALRRNRAWSGPA